MSTKSPGRKKKILIIDDDVHMTAPLSQFLREHDFSVKVSSTGIEGIKSAQTWEPDVILLDIGLPDVAGSEVFDEIKKRQTKARVIMFSGSDDVESIIKFMRLGASDYITKPVLGEELIWKIDRALELGSSVDRQRLIDELKLENMQLTSEVNDLQGQLKSERTDLEKLSAEMAVKDGHSRFTVFAIRTFYIILSSLITWLFFQTKLITDTKLLFLLPLLLFLLLLFPIERIQRISAKYRSTEASVDVDSQATKNGPDSPSGER